MIKVKGEERHSLRSTCWSLCIAEYVIVGIVVVCISFSFLQLVASLACRDGGGGAIPPACDLSVNSR